MMDSDVVESSSSAPRFSSAYERLNDSSALSSLIRKQTLYSVGNTEVIECGHTKERSLTFALKRCQKANMSPRAKQLAANEVQIARQLSIDSIDELVKIHGAFEAEDAFYQVMERCDRNLYEILHQEDGFHFTEEEVCNDVLDPLLRALAFLHRKNVVHRDVKLENLLLGEKGLKLADFGLSLDLTRDRPNSRVGTIDYNAPEMFGSESPKSKENGYNEKVDIWAVGVVTYELLFGQAPFFHEDEKETARLIQEGTLPGFMGFWSAECQDFLHQALRKKPDERPSAESLLNHPWMKHHSVTRSKSLNQKGDLMDTRIRSLASPNQSLSPRMGTWKISSQLVDPNDEMLLSTDSESSVVLLSRLRSPSGDYDRDGADDIQPRSPLRRQNSRGSRTSSDILSYVDAAPELEDLREELAESYLHPVLSPELVHLESLGSTEANSLPNLLPSIKNVRRQHSVGKSRFADHE